MKRRMLALVGALILAALLMVMALGFPKRGSREVSKVTPTPEGASMDVALAVVNGERVVLDVWREQYLLDQVMSRLSGQPAPTPRETLERLINSTLLLDAYPPGEEIAGRDVSQRMAQLKAVWGVDETVLRTRLEAVGLSREVLTHTVAQLLAVESAQAQLKATGADLDTWLQDARRRAQLRIDESLLADVTPPIAPTSTPRPDM